MSSKLQLVFFLSVCIIGAFTAVHSRNLDLDNLFEGGNSNSDNSEEIKRGLELGRRDPKQSGEDDEDSGETDAGGGEDEDEEGTTKNTLSNHALFQTLSKVVAAGGKDDFTKKTDAEKHSIGKV